MSFELYSSFNDEPARNLRQIKVYLANAAAPLESAGYVAGSIENTDQHPAAKLLFVKVEDERLRGQGLAGRMLLGFAALLKTEGITEFQSRMNTPEALKAMAKVYDDDAIHIYDHFEPRTIQEDGSFQRLPMTVQQALMTAERIREQTPPEDWRRLRDLGAFVSLASIDTDGLSLPKPQPWQDY